MKINFYCRKFVEFVFCKLKIILNLANKIISVFSKPVLCKATNQLIDKCIAFTLHTHCYEKVKYDGTATAGKNVQLCNY